MQVLCQIICDDMMFDAGETQQNDLRGGVAPWTQGLHRPLRQKLNESMRCDVLIVGAGITGSLMAEHLTQLGHAVCVIDRERAGFGSTAASTSMLQWEIDRSLGDLVKLYGFDRAAGIYHRSLAAVSGLSDLVTSLQLGAALRQRSSLLLAAAEVGARDLLDEHELRNRAGLPGHFLDHPTLLKEYDINREAAIVSPGSADADPLRLSHALIAVAAARHAGMFDAEVVKYDSTGKAAFIETDDGHVIEANHVVLATGYVMPDFLKSDLHNTASSWAIATPPQLPEHLWRDGALIWEASEKYLYARTTADNRIVIGGEDDDQIVEPEARDALMPAKAATLLKKLSVLWPRANPVAEFVWSGAFGTTHDGLPLIGTVPGRPRFHAAYGYGGNGITFSYMASRIIGQLVGGQSQAWFEDFAIDRPEPGTV